MKTTTVSQHGFDGALFEAAGNREKKCIILNLMFAPTSGFAKKPAKWLVENGISALTIGVYGTKQTPADQSQVPIEYITRACKYLKEKGYKKIGIVGLSFSAVMSLYAASVCKEITLTVAISGFDMVFEGVLGRGTQYPSGKSSFTYCGKDIPFQSFGLNKDGYMNAMKLAKEQHGEIYGRDLWENAIQNNKNENAYIPVERIWGKLLLLGAVNDTCWDSTGAADRMKSRISNQGGTAEVTIKKYEMATHMLYPESVPFINLMCRMSFKAYKQNPEACKEARHDVSNQILNAIRNW